MTQLQINFHKLKIPTDITVTQRSRREKFILKNHDMYII